MNNQNRCTKAHRYSVDTCLACENEELAADSLAWHSQKAALEQRIKDLEEERDRLVMRWKLEVEGE